MAEEAKKQEAKVAEPKEKEQPKQQAAKDDKRAGGVHKKD